MFDDLFGLEKPHKISEGDEVEHLTTVYDLGALAMVRGLLEEENIPYLVRERGSGSAMRLIVGFSMYGTDIYVPADALEKASELVEGLFVGPEDGETIEDLVSEDADTAAEETDAEEEA